MSVAVVDRLEMIDVADRQCDRNAMALEGSEFEIDPLLEDAPVVEPGEDIGLAQAAQFVALPA